MRGRQKVFSDFFWTFFSFPDFGENLVTFSKSEKLKKNKIKNRAAGGGKNGARFSVTALQLALHAFFRYERITS